MFIFNFVVQFLNKRHFRSKIGDIAPLIRLKCRRCHSNIYFFSSYPIHVLATMKTICRLEFNNFPTIPDDPHFSAAPDRSLTFEVIYTSCV